jgi:hypothetical protein
MYSREEILVQDFLKCLPVSPFSKEGPIKFVTEFDYRRGRTDVIALNSDGEIIAFEAKLERWREALHQAYRNTCFAHYSYVILPEDTAKLAHKYYKEFSKRSVGLCYLSSGELIIAHRANRTDPFQEWLSYQASTAITEGDLNGKQQ